MLHGLIVMLIYILFLTDSVNSVTPAEQCVRAEPTESSSETTNTPTTERAGNIGQYNGSETTAFTSETTKTTTIEPKGGNGEFITYCNTFLLQLQNSKFCI